MPIDDRWLKPQGVTRPTLRKMPDDWLQGHDPDAYVVITGPANRRNPPPFAPGHRMLLHGVWYSKLYAEVEITRAVRRQLLCPDPARLRGRERCAGADHGLPNEVDQLVQPIRTGHSRYMTRSHYV